MNDESLAAGSHALIDSMTSRARSAGVQIETSTQVNELLVRDGRVTGCNACIDRGRLRSQGGGDRLHNGSVEPGSVYESA